MAKFSYQDYKSKEGNTPSQAQSDQPKIQFMGYFLKKDGASVIVRFPYSTPDDFNVEHVHEVKFPGSQYPQKVECTKGEENGCPLCDSNTKRVDRFLVKAIAYVINNETNTIELVPVVWDRPMKYADELADKMSNYGDLRDYLFKIKRNGTGQDTTYSTDVVLNKTVYRDDVYVKDFSAIEDLNPSFLLVRRMSKYLELTQPKEEEINEDEAVEEEVKPTYTPTSGETVQREDPTERRPIRRFSNIQ